MRRRLVRCAPMAIVAVILQPTIAAVHGQSDADVRAVEVRQQEAWNRHDAREYAALFTDDGDVVNVLGWWWKGRAEIERKLTAAFAFVFRESTLTLETTDVRFMSPTISVAHVTWSMTGAKSPNGAAPPRTGIQVQLLVKRDGRGRSPRFRIPTACRRRRFALGLQAARSLTTDLVERRHDPPSRD